MDWKSALKMAVGGVALFSLGAVTTMFVTGRMTVGAALAELSGRAQIEQVVREYLLTHPDILVEMDNRLNQNREAAADKARTDALFTIGTKALFDPKVAYLEGPADAKITVAEFFDYRCPHCKASLGAVKALAAQNKDVRIAMIERPILTPNSFVAAQAAVASRRQPGKYMPFHFALMQTAGELPKERILDIAKSVGIDIVKLEKDMEDVAVIEEVNASTRLADSLHFNGTPTFVINDKIFMGELTAEELTRFIRGS